MLKYKRILLKLSGEALAGNKEFGFSNEVLESFAKQIKVYKLLLLSAVEIFSVG